MAVTVERAVLDQAEDIVQMHWDAEDWLAEQQIDPPSRGDVSLADVREQIEAGEWRVARSGGIVAGALRVLRADPDIWVDDEVPATYVARVMTDRRHASPGLGAQLLRWVDEHARSEAVSVVRLECVETNRRLRTYYEEQGFFLVGRRDFEVEWPSVVLLEKAVR
ncbi:GNAT family N-acetyltransferase [Rhodococcus oxybenzonivorans]|uniref:GNAT family N-acetyltransferase n=1 Tax=Rhodococcus oxybenzonivorans TaxID=1990687 RepID=A0A2S2BSN1_9NOCA|nr:GNAT family N-acetyltransferase [Rhodococcus oxybenzonivorans]AWK71637.1 GNAT family N-acetyltransferase [Rhodococcus oxybenzonivorans]